MSDKTIDVRLKQRYDTEANWNSANPVLLEGEMVISSDKNGKYKVGNGTSTWKQLSYAKSNLEKSDVVNALGYTPPTTDTKDYSALTNKPTLNGVEISGDKTLEDYGIKAVVTVTNIADTKTLTADKTFEEIYNLVNEGMDVEVELVTKPTSTSEILSTAKGFVLSSCSQFAIGFVKSHGLYTRSINFTPSGNIIYISKYITPTATSYGGIKADPVTEEDTIPVRFNSEDGKAYVEDKTTFIINITKDDETDTYTADQTFDDAYAAYQAGRDVVMRRGATPYRLSTCAVSMMVFVCHKYSNIKSQIFSLMKNNTVIYHEYSKYASTLNPGGITAEAKQETDTVPVRVDSETGRAYVKSYDTELDQKADVDHTHSYAGSSSAGGSANSAVKLDTSAGSATQPVYFSGGKPVACTYTLAKSVPNNAVFTDTNTWIALKGSTTEAAGTAGYAPAPAAGSSNRYLRCDGTWQVPPDTNTTYTLGSFGITATASELNYMDGVTSNVQTQLNGKASNGHTHSTATTSSNGFMSSSDKSKLDGIASGANKYTHPSYTSKSSGLYKITVDSQGHISGASAVTKSDITALGIPGQDTNTTYGIGNSSTAGITKLYTILGSNEDGTMTQEAITNEIDNLSDSIKNHTHNVMGGNGTYTAGKAGFVPAPPAGARDRYLRSDGTWGAYADSQTNGLMSKNSYNKLLTMEQDLNELETFTNLINGRLIDVEDGYNNMNIHISDKLEYADFSTFTKNITVTVKNGYGEAGVNIYQSGYAVLGAIGFSTSSTYYSIYKIAKTSTMNIDVGIRRVDGATSNESVVVYLTLLAIKTS